MTDNQQQKTIMSNMYLLMQQEQYDKIDDIFFHMDVDALSTLDMLAYIRPTCVYRCFLTQWYQLADKCYHNTVIEYGEDRADSIFEGLR